MAERVVEALLTLAAVVVALGVIWKFPPFRKPATFISRRLVVEPLAAWFRGEVRGVIRAELKQPNGGASIPDLSAQITELRAYTHDGVHELRNTMTPLKGRIDILWEQSGLPPFTSEEES